MSDIVRFMNTENKQQPADEQATIEGFSFINQIDRNLRVVASLHTRAPAGGPIELKTQIYYHNEYVATLSFYLHEYTLQECKHLAQNIKDNDYLLYAIDEYLSGDMVE